MAIAHVCVHCGRDLARVRPQREPHYGLNLVRCPGCGAASVRRRHPVWHGWRTFRRLDFALTMIFLRFLGIASMTVLCAFGAILTIALASELERPGATLSREMLLFLLLFYLLLPLTLGTFLRTAFAHVAPWKMWVGWLVWMTAVVCVISLHPLESQMDPRGVLGGELSMFRWVFYGCLFIVVPGVAAIVALLILALPGIFTGNLLLRLRDALASAKWRWRRKRLRLAGAANV